MGLFKEQIVHCFPRTLAGDAMNRYLFLDNAKTRDWKELAKEFVHHYNYNVQLMDCNIVNTGDISTSQPPSIRYSHVTLFWLFIKRYVAILVRYRPISRNAEKISIFSKMV